MFSFVGDTILDPFMGSGTTALAAKNQNRNSIGYEINQKFQKFYEEKVVLSNREDNHIFSVREDTSEFDLQKSIDTLPYHFIDIHKLDKQIDVKQHTYGSKFETDKSVLDDKSNIFSHIKQKRRTDRCGAYGYGEPCSQRTSATHDSKGDLLPTCR